MRWADKLAHLPAIVDVPRGASLAGFRRNGRLEAIKFFLLLVLHLVQSLEMLDLSKLI
jgi:hypothetical protein